MISELQAKLIGRRGKWAEGRLKKFLKDQEVHNSTHYRFPDARAGSFTVTPCDFMFMREGKLTLLEVKEVEHAHRLPHRNFSPDQVARMRVWALAGANANVIVFHSTLNQWRVIPIYYFLQRDAGSWSLTEYPLLSERDAFQAAIK
jgi:hypothetical protein